MNPNPEFPTAVSTRNAEAINRFEELDREFLELARTHNARELQFPTLISKALLERAEYQAIEQAHLPLGEGDYGFSDLLAVRRRNPLGPAIFAEVITITGIISTVRSEDVGPPKLNQPGVIFKMCHSCLDGEETRGR
jgi:hypothetical protein